MIQKKIFIHIPKNAGSTIYSAESLRNNIVHISPEIQKHKNYAKEVLDNVGTFSDQSNNEVFSIPEYEISQQHSRWIDLDTSATQKYSSFK